MADRIRVTEGQLKCVRKLIKNLCANYYNGECIALDLWYGPERCPQIDAYSLLCRYFKRSVLPAEPELEAELLRTKPKKRCAVCGKPFFTRSNAAKYCKDCAKEQHRKREQERQRKRYESLRK